MRASSMMTIHRKNGWDVARDRPATEDRRVAHATVRGCMLKVQWIDAGREPPKEPPHLGYLNGRDIDISGCAANTCSIPLPYPAKRCGRYEIECDQCALTAAVSTTGRSDDPRWLKVACKNSPIHDYCHGCGAEMTKPELHPYPAPGYCQDCFRAGRHRKPSPPTPWRKFFRPPGRSPSRSWSP
jgi:hypothetical protein